MSPFVEPRFRSIGNTFLQDDSPATDRLQRRHSFSHLADVHEHIEVELKPLVALRTPARREGWGRSPASSPSTASCGSAAALLKLPLEAFGQKSGPRRGGLRSAKQQSCGLAPAAIPSAARGQGVGGATPAPAAQRDLVRELLQTGSNALLRAAALARDMKLPRELRGDLCMERAECTAEPIATTL